MTAQNGQCDRALNEGFDRDMRALSLRLKLRIGEFSDNSKAARAGKVMMWSLGFGAVMPDGQQYLACFYSKAEAFEKFELPAMDRLYERISTLPDGPERLALMRQAERLALVWMPCKFRQLRSETHSTQARPMGCWCPVFRNDWFHLVDVV